jgi:hypothetical protein
LSLVIVVVGQCWSVLTRLTLDMGIGGYEKDKSWLRST